MHGKTNTVPGWNQLRDGRVPPSSGVTIYLMVGCPACERVKPQMRQLAKQPNRPELHAHVYDPSTVPMVPASVNSFPTVMINGRKRNEHAETVLERLNNNARVNAGNNGAGNGRAGNNGAGNARAANNGAGNARAGNNGAGNGRNGNNGAANGRAGNNGAANGRAANNGAVNGRAANNGAVNGRAGNNGTGNGRAANNGDKAAAKKPGMFGRMSTWVSGKSK